MGQNFDSFIITCCVLLSLYDNGSIDIFQAVFWKIGLSLGDKALSFALCKLGCSGGLTFAIVFAVRAMITGEAESIKMMMSPTGADSGASGASGSESSSPSEAKNESNFSFEFHQLQDKTFSAFQNLIYYDNNFLKYLHCLNNRAGCLFFKIFNLPGLE